MHYTIPMTTKKLIIYADGGARGNPGPAAAGYAILDANEDLLEEGGQYLGETTNNQAEYAAVRLALEKAAKFNPEEIEFFLDSELVVKQLNGQYKVKNKALKPRVEEVRLKEAKYQKVTYKHVMREFNKLADRQVNVVLDNQKK